MLAGASLIMAACSGDDDAEVVTEGTTEETTGGTEPVSEGTEPGSTEPESTEGGDGSVPAAAGDVGTVGGSGCGIPHGPYEDPGEPAGEVRVAWNDPLLSFNTNWSAATRDCQRQPGLPDGSRERWRILVLRR